MTVPSDQHNNLVLLGAKWLRKQGFGVVATELDAAGCRERPDVIGFRSSSSAIIEVKVSRSDFLADARKPERQGAMGVGVYRFYLCPAGLIEVQDLPPRWGLLHAQEGKVFEVLRPLGNIWPEFGRAVELAEWSRFQHQPDTAAERGALYSIARRLAK
jgi:hypothetical protein